MEQKNFEQWNGFAAGDWQKEINVRDFIQKNVTPYEGTDEFLETKTEMTERLMERLNSLLKLEQDFGGVLDIDTQSVSSLTAYQPGYLDKAEELIVGLQTNRPLKRLTAMSFLIRSNRNSSTGQPTMTVYSACIRKRCVKSGTQAY